MPKFCIIIEKPLSCEPYLRYYSMFSSQIASNDVILRLYQDTRTVFKLADIALLTTENDPISLAKKLNYHVKTGKILNPRKGIYTKPNYSIEELSGKLYTPSYISLHYILQRDGIIFQFSESVTSKTDSIDAWTVLCLSPLLKTFARSSSNVEP